MIPISLTIEGLYSYQKKQTIDFTALTDAGLFGIFGAVGSGKSSILEAITFALYGETERMNSKENRNYNMMNLRSNRSVIDFSFLNFENKKYRITRTFRRNSKRFDDVKPVDTVLYLWENEDWQPQESSKVDDIIGLTYQNFKRTIIIPQGQFKEFLELGAKDRTQMMKDIFGLQRFDLQGKTAHLYAETKSNIDNLEGQLMGFETISEAEIVTLKQNLEAESVVNKGLEEQFATASELFSTLKLLKSDVETLAQKEKELVILESQKTEKDALVKKADTYDSVNFSFSALLDQQTKTQNEISHKTKEKEEAQKTLAQLQQKASNLKTAIDKLQAEYEKLPQRRIEELDLAFIHQMAELKNELNTIQERIKNGIPKVDELKENADVLIAQQEKLQQELEALKASKPNASLLLAIEKWFGQKEYLEEKILSENKKILPLQNSLKEYKLSLEALDIDKNTFQEIFEKRAEAIKENLQALRLKESNIKVQDQLSLFAHTLNDGEPCPLCGALEHPNVLEAADFSKEYKEILSAIDQQNIALDDMAKQKAMVEQTVFKIHTTEQQILDVEKEINQLKNQLNAHQQSFLWEGFEAGNKQYFEAQKQNLVNIEKEIASTESTVAARVKQLKTAQDNIEKYKAAIDGFKLSAAQMEAKIAQAENNLKLLRFENFAHQSKEDIASMMQALKSENDTLQSEYELKNKELNDIKPNIASQESKLAAIQSRKEELEAEQEHQYSNIEKLLQEHGLGSIDAVKTILAAALDTQSIRSEIEAFKVEYATLSQSITTLKEKTKDKIFSQEAYSIQEENVLALQKELKQFTEKMAHLRAEIQRQENELKKKKDLQAAYDTLEKRFQNLAQLKRLFDKAGFVEYVSSINLRQLCDMANVRFHRLTRNQLSLQLNENNDFEIIDYLNEGKTRSVKTLSGGQSFQVSLSLALALAENVQSNAKAEKNFFFIDEGFGTQDAASVNIVFETLMNLQKENRIVGIISHVDELKEKIPAALSIVKDEEQGSVINKSWV